MQTEVHTSSFEANAGGILTTAIALPFLGPLAFLVGALVRAGIKHDVAREMETTCADTEEAVKNEWLRHRYPDERHLTVCTERDGNRRTRTFHYEEGDQPSWKSPLPLPFPFSASQFDVPSIPTTFPDIISPFKREPYSFPLPLHRVWGGTEEDE